MKAIILCAAVLGALGTLLYQVKTGIDEQQTKLKHLQKVIIKTERNIAVLEAEWAFLSRPDRVMNLSKNLLGMKPISQDRILSLDSIPMRYSTKMEQILNKPLCTTC